MAEPQQGSPAAIPSEGHCSRNIHLLSFILPYCLAIKQNFSLSSSFIPHLSSLGKHSITQKQYGILVPTSLGLWMWLELCALPGQESSVTEGAKLWPQISGLPFGIASDQNAQGR